uniref:CCHC-type domain-containing protein n=2 Tax=Brassica TaxID=3705 RepID=A0A0D3A938_BRAOL
MGDVGQDQAAINAQLLADNEELRASLRAITAELAQLRQGGRPNGPRPPGRNQPDPHDTDSDADSTDDTRSQDEDRPNWGGRRNARGRTVPMIRAVRTRRDRTGEGTKTVEEYYEEFEALRNKLDTDKPEETMMSQILEGLQDRIARKVERQQYEDFNDLLHFATQAKQHIKRKTASDKGKAIEVESRLKTNQADSSNAPKPEQGKTLAQTLHTRDIVCYKCQGKGHYARDFPNKRVKVLKGDGEYESQDELEAAAVISDEEVTDYPETGELLVTRRALRTLFDPETIQRENIFHTRCSIDHKVCSLIIDGGSCTNVASKYLVDKLGLVKTAHPRPYRLKWLNDETELKIAEQVVVSFGIGKYHDQVKCDVVPMQAGHILLGRPWQFDKETLHHGRTNIYSFTHNNKKHSLAPLSPQEVHDMQKAMAQSSQVSNTNLYMTSGQVFKSLQRETQVLLMIFKEGCFAGFEAPEVPDVVQDLMGCYKDVVSIGIQKRTQRRSLLRPDRLLCIELEV